jgi:hypothetical protein
MPLPRIRFTTRRIMVVVACLGIGLGAARWVRSKLSTVYASGYSESQFRRLRIGMTREQVESIVGPPLRKDSTSQRWSPFENWIYSEPPPLGVVYGPGGEDYWRRWVMFDPNNNNKIIAIIDDYYVD